MLENYKFKPLDINRIIISLDRLTRFKDPEIKYLRVYKDIITGNLITPKFKKSDLDKMDYKQLTDIAVYIINESLKKLCSRMDNDYLINQRLLDYEKGLFRINANTEKLLMNKINYKAALTVFPEELPLNLKWLELLGKSKFPEKDSYECGYHFPIKKLVICEGITEELLLPEFAKILDYDFDKNGIHIISAGGKNQVVKLFYELSEKLNIPIFILLDSDAKINYDEILPKLRDYDRIHILSHGEFEDILPVKLIEKALKFSIMNISSIPSGELDKSSGMVHYLEEFYRDRGVHEFKKADFAQVIKLNITGLEDVSDEFKEIIFELKNLPVLTGECL